LLVILVWLMVRTIQHGPAETTVLDLDANLMPEPAE
jgi:hypothetical protein